MLTEDNELETALSAVPVCADSAATEVTGYEAAGENNTPAPEDPPPEPKHTRKKKADTAESPDIPQTAPAAAEAEVSQEKGSLRRKRKSNTILTVEANADVETAESAVQTAWHEIHNAYRTHRILTGFLGGIEQTDTGKTIAVVEHKGFRVVIPLKEMVLGIPNNLSGREYADMIIRQNKLLSNMLGCEIDFVIKGIDAKTHSIVASRTEAMMKKRQLFYFDPDSEGNYRVYEGRVVQARVIAVAEKAIRIEAFGVECSIMARDLSWEWIGDARDRFSVGNQILVRIQKVNRDSIESLSIKADVKSVSENRQNNLSLCRVQSKYAGKVTDVYKGAVYVRLTNGVNAIAHSCYDRRMPGKKDDVSFAVTGIDEERGVALGIITRIIRQNL